jgi:isoleucyl-tRNA synthetase
VAPDGTFTAEAGDYQGRWVKDADREIIRQLRAEGKLFHQEQYLHDYPFCWRAEEDPLIQYPRRSWFIRTTQFRDRMLANNRRIQWLPEHIREGRFGNFLETNVDWALSRERFWGTPLPIWVCDQTGYAEAVADYDELLAKPGVAGTEVWEEAKRAKPGLPDDLKVHKPYIDAITYDSPKAPGSRMRRVPEVIDCWFDSGAMPFAQWGYPKQPGSRERLADQFPADFISEAIDQTRGWFYSLLAISTLLFGEEDGPGPGKPTAFLQTERPTIELPHPYRTCVVLGLVLGEDGAKMSKSKRNYREPQEIFDRYGADAMRWYIFANQPPWTSIRFSEQAIRESIPEFLLRLWNVYSFFVIYANIDGFDPAASISGPAGQLTADVLAAGEGYRPPAQRCELNRTAAAVIEAMDRYDNFAACGRLNEFVEGLSNWYVRRSRDRFWSGEKSADKLDAYWTLYECLLTAAKLVAPFIPFTAEALWQNLAVEEFRGRAVDSVHLCDYPAPQTEAIDDELSPRMALVREIVSLGRSARMGARLKVRQPLSRVEVVLVDPNQQPWLEEHAGLIAEELNVKRVEYARNADQYVSYTVLPDLKRLGPRLGKRLPAVRKALSEADGAGLLRQLDAEGRVTLRLPDGPVVLDSNDIQVRMQAKEGWAAAHGRACVVVLATELTTELILEGLAREMVRVIQDHRKERGCQFTDRIRVGVVTKSEDLLTALKQFGEYVCRETLAVELQTEAVPGVEPVEVKVAGHALALYVKVESEH